MSAKRSVEHQAWRHYTAGLRIEALEHEGLGVLGQSTPLVDGSKAASDSSVTGGSGTPSAQNSILGFC